MAEIKMNYSDVKRYCEETNKELEIGNFNEVFHGVHIDGSIFILPHAKVEVKPFENELQWIVVFTEHHDYFIFCSDELNHYSFYKTKNSFENEIDYEISKNHNDFVKDSRWDQETPFKQLEVLNQEIHNLSGNIANNFAENNKEPAKKLLVLSFQIAGLIPFLKRGSW